MLPHCVQFCIELPLKFNWSFKNNVPFLGHLFLSGPFWDLNIVPYNPNYQDLNGIFAVMICCDKGIRQCCQSLISIRSIIGAFLEHFDLFLKNKKDDPG